MSYGFQSKKLSDPDSNPKGAGVRVSFETQETSQTKGLFTPPQINIFWGGVSGMGVGRVHFGKLNMDKTQV